MYMPLAAHAVLRPLRSDAYDQGFEAYERGDTTNPYDDRDAQFDEWEKGQTDAHDQR